jgi:small subunit ribosomal protein S9
MREGSGKITVNGRPFDQYFPGELQRNSILSPFKVVGGNHNFDLVVRVAGGGVEGQAIALRHGISRALVQEDDNCRHDLKTHGYLTRDPRKREREKYGRAGARKRYQFSKR